MNSIDHWIAQQCDGIKQALSPLLHPGEPCALVGYPDHWNAGDMAIWAGTIVLLNDLKVKVNYACDSWSYDPHKLERDLPKGPILIHGGGNFGDVYADEVYLREQILKDFSHRTIIQLPQSIWFQHQAGIESMAHLLKQQKDFTLLARDHASVNFSKTHFDVNTVLSPDYAVYLSDLTSYTAEPVTDIYALCREDIEAEQNASNNIQDIPFSDWMVPGLETQQFSPMSRVLLRFIPRPITGDYSCPPSRSWAWKFYPLFWNALAQDRVKRGCGYLSRGKVVITDRLHGYILSTLMRKPNVVCDNGINKIVNYMETWPLKTDISAFAENRQEAADIAKQMVESGTDFQLSQF